MFVWATAVAACFEPFAAFRNNSGSFATLAAIRRASSRVSVIRSVEIN